MSASPPVLGHSIASAPRAQPRISRIRNVLSNWGIFLFSAGISFFLSPFIVHTLGDAAYGIWSLLGSLVGYLGLLDFGVRGAVTRYIARAHSRSEHGEARGIASSALMVFGLAGALAIVVSLAVAISVGRLFNLPRDLLGAARIVVILGGINVAVSIISGVYGGIIVGLQRFDYVNGVESAIQLVRAAAIVVALKLGQGLVALASIQLVMSVGRGLASYALSRRVYSEVSVRFRDCRRHHLATIFTFSASAFILQASGKLILYSDSVVIGAFLPVGMITLFVIASSLVEYARAPISGISQTLTPWVSALEAGSKTEELKRTLLTGARISTLVVLPIALTFMLRGSTFVGLWMGAAYAGPSGRVLWILSLALWFGAGYQAVVSTMMGISKHHGFVAVFVVEALLNLGLSILLLRRYGIAGVAWGTTLPRIIAAVAFTPWYVRRVLGAQMKTFWLEVWARPAAGMIPFATGTYLLEHWWRTSNLAVFFSQVALALPLAVVGTWVLSMTQEEQRALRARIASIGWGRQSHGQRPAGEE